MKKLDELPPVFVLAPASFSDPEPARRLIVIVPETDLDLAIAARKIRDLAVAFGGRVLFFGPVKDTAYEPALRRQMIALSAMVADEHILIETKIETGMNWLNSLKAELHYKDAVACFAGQRFGHRPLNQILESNLDVTIYVLAGNSLPMEVSHSNWKSGLLMWLGSLGLIVGFLYFQWKITQFPQDWAHTMLLYISVFAEVAALWTWNKLAG